MATGKKWGGVREQEWTEDSLGHQTELLALIRLPCPRLLHACNRHHQRESWHHVRTWGLTFCHAVGFKMPRA